MIIGVGTDLLEIARIADILQRASAQPFLNRLLVKHEQQELAGKQGRQAEFVAGRFAAKEAVSKALGCGIGSKLSFHDIVITSDEAGRPCCRLSTQARETEPLWRDVKLHVSISHTASFVTAFAIAERRDGGATSQEMEG